VSVKIMSQVFDRYPSGGGEMLLALALADHASDDGTRVYPSIGALAAKTRQSERTVQYQLRRMEDAGWLILVNAGHGGRSLSREYRISTEWINGADFDDLQKGAEIAPFQNGANGEKGAIHDTKGCNPQHKRVQPVAPANNRHRTINEPSVGGERAQAPAAPHHGLDGDGVGLPAAPKPAKARKTALPDDLQPCATAQAFAAQHGLDMAEELAAFADHHAAAGTTMADWQAGLRNWLRNSVKFRSRDERAALQRGAVATTGETPYQRSMRERMQEAVPAIARKAPGAKPVQAVEFFRTVEAAPELRRIGGAA
jgi:hypothetical protein